MYSLVRIGPAKTTQVIPLMMRLPGEAASIVAGLELVVPRWQHTLPTWSLSTGIHFKPIGLSSGICLGTISLQWPLLSQKTEAAVDLDGLASCVLYLGLRRACTSLVVSIDTRCGVCHMHDLYQMCSVITRLDRGGC